MNPQPSVNYDFDLAVIGGGAGGFFTALQAAYFNPALRVAVFEQGSRFLQKVRISGGGRCNVTHACFEPELLSQHYPRGQRALRAAFHRWQPRDTVQWFAERRVVLKTEVDGRMFPVSDDSQTIIDCFLGEARKSKVLLQTHCGLQNFAPLADANGWQLQFDNPAFASLTCRYLCMAVGSLKSSRLQNRLEALGHTIAPLAPSLFALNCSDRRISGLAGVSVPLASVGLADSKKRYQGPLLITHRGLSGPAILRLSAWEARVFAERNYHTEICVDWLPQLDADRIENWMDQQRMENGTKSVHNTPPSELPKRLWLKLCESADCADSLAWNQVSKNQRRQLVEAIKDCRFKVTGKTTNKDEFVTCGGVALKDVDFRTMESKHCPKLYFCGECLDIDGITGGFNFQAAWTTATIAAKSIAEAAAGSFNRGHED